MGNHIKSIVKPVKKKGKTITHQDTSIRRVSNYRCSTFIKKKNIIVKGEYINKYRGKRNAMILLFDLESGNLKGESRV